MAKKVAAIVKVQLPGGAATPAPPLGPALGQHGANIMQFVKEYNAKTSNMAGQVSRRPLGLKREAGLPPERRPGSSLEIRSGRSPR